MGQGALTALAQIGADALALPIEQCASCAPAVRASRRGHGGRLRRIRRPRAWRSTTPAATSIAKLAELATNDPRSPLYGAGNAGVIARDGRLTRRDDETRSESYAAIMARAGVAEIVGEGKGAADPALQAQYAMHAHGAVFAEVKVDPDLGMVRATRLVGAFAAGRIINPRLVRASISAA